MSKKDFRQRVSPSPRAADYPTTEEFDGGRRDFLARFGAAVLGAGVLGSVLTACGDRVVNAKPDQGMMAGAAPPPDAKVDSAPPLPPDGEAPMPDAKIDEPDGLLAGGAPMPDAQADIKPPEPPMGKRTPPDAAIDQQASPGFAPLPDAKVDPKPNP